MPKVRALEDHGRHKAGDEYFCTVPVLQDRIDAGIVERADADNPHGLTVRTKPGGWADVVDQGGAVLNEKSLRADEAQAFIESYEPEDADDRDGSAEG